MSAAGGRDIRALAERSGFDPKATVSDAVATLEDALRVRLLDRTSKGVEPTIYANALLKRGHVIFDELRQGIRDIKFPFGSTRTSVDHLTDCRKPPVPPPKCYSLARYDAWGQNVGAGWCPWDASIPQSGACSWLPGRCQ